MKRFALTVLLGAVLGVPVAVGISFALHLDATGGFVVGMFCGAAGQMTVAAWLLRDL